MYNYVFITNMIDLFTAQALDASPLGSWMDVEALQELADMKATTLQSLEAKGLEASPAAPVSSQLAKGFAQRGLLVTPKSEEDLRCGVG